MDSDKIRLIREQARKLKEDNAVQIPVAQVVEEQVAVPTLPSEYQPTSFLSISRKNGGTKNVTDLISKFAIEPEVYKAIQMTEEQGEKINKALGRMVTGVAAAVPIVCRGHNCSYREACVTGDTLVLTAKGLKAISDISIGEKVYSVSVENFLIEKDSVTNKTITSSQKVYEIKTKLGNSIKVTDNHPILSKVDEEIYKWKTLLTGLQIGSLILVSDNTSEDILEDSVGDLFLDTIISINYVGIEDVYDITISNNKNFIANNIVVHNCPFFKENLHVIGEKCPIEVSLIEIWAKEFIEELNIDPNSIVELQVLSRLLEISILERRLTTYMSLHEQDLTMEFIANVDPMGNPITNKGPSIAFEQREKLDRAKMKLLESLNATRERKQKIKEQTRQDSKVDDSVAEIRNTVLDIAKRMHMQDVSKIVGES